MLREKNSSYLGPRTILQSPINDEMKTKSDDLGALLWGQTHQDDYSNDTLQHVCKYVSSHA